jgi:hypothetical protein
MAVRAVVYECPVMPSVLIVATAGWFSIHTYGGVFGFLHYDIIILNMSFGTVDDYIIVMHSID